MEYRENKRISREDFRPGQVLAVCVCVCVCVRMYAYDIHTCISQSITFVTFLHESRISEDTLVALRIHVYVCMYACMYVCMCVRIRIRT